MLLSCPTQSMHIRRRKPKPIHFKVGETETKTLAVNAKRGIAQEKSSHSRDRGIDKGTVTIARVVKDNRTKTSRWEGE